MDMNKGGRIARVSGGAGWMATNGENWNNGNSTINKIY